MNNDDLERLLADSFDHQARASVGDRTGAPRPRFLDVEDEPRQQRTVRWLAPLAAAAAVVAVVAGVAVVQNHSSGTGPVAHQPGTLLHSPGPTTSLTRVTGPHQAVHVRLLNSDNSVVGVGMPVIAYFSRRITDASALSQATALTVNGEPAHGAWYFEYSKADPSYPVEGHFRMASFWPADAKINVQLPITDLSAGKGMAYDDSLSLSFATGAKQVVTVDDVKHDLVLQRDDQTVAKARVSLGATKTPTLRGTKVIMEKNSVITMRSPGFYERGVKWTQRLTYSGEYLHAAPWNTGNIERGIDSSNGCTNLMPSDAQSLYSTLRIGDVVQYPNARGPEMSLSDGYGDWNVSWGQWQTGGLVPTS